VTTPRLPGVRFETRSPRPSLVLPRMDIAAFVGFAARGPLHLPVAVEDVAAFAEVFGEDAPLAWDQRRGALAHAYLAPCVRAFFRGGGRRCWVVRVAEDDACASRFALDGMWRIDGSPLGPVELEARAPGSWADSLQVAASLARAALPVTDELLATAWEPGDELELGALPDRVIPGDLLRLSVGDRRHWAVVRAGGAQSRALVVFEDILSPPGLAGAGSPPGLASFELLRCDLWVWQGQAAPLRLSDLGFAPEHPRYLAGLPDDAALFGGTAPAAPPDGPDRRALWRDAAAPRFPLAGRGGGLILPLDLPDVPDRASAAQARHDGRTALERDGLSRFGAHLFLDSGLADVQLEALAAQAEWLRYQQPRPRRLRGIHTLLEIEEVSLVAVPDAVHSGWRRETPPEEPPESRKPLPSPPPPRPDWWAFLECGAPGAPTLEAEASPLGKVRLRWHSTSPAEAWAVEKSKRADFRPGSVAGDWSVAERWLVVEEPEPDTYFYRVRALGGAEPGPWSNVAVAIVPKPIVPGTGPSGPPRDQFLRCGLRVLNRPVLGLEQAPSADGTFLLSWTMPDGDGVRFIVEEARQRDWSDAHLLAETSRLELFVYGRPAGVYYYRVRAVLDDATSDWSGGLLVEVWAAPPWTVLAPPAEPAALLETVAAVQRALLRACAVRGDILALLSLPAAAREPAALAAVGLLGGPRAAGLAVSWREYGEPGCQTPAGRVTERGATIPPLGFGEAAALSYGALYHPWPMARDEDRAADVAAVPPDGAVCGLYAQRALERGAWIAPANQPLPALVALTPRLAPERRPDLLAGQINEVLQTPRGFLTLSAQTLSRDPELRPVGARRLLMLLRRLALRQGAGYVFEPNSERFRRIVERDFEQLLGWMFERGAFAGATPRASFRVEARASGGGEDGRLTVELRVAPSQPLVFLTVRLVQTGDRARVVEVR
jgi:hypothetical protein